MKASELVTPRKRQTPEERFGDDFIYAAQCFKCDAFRIPNVRKYSEKQIYKKQDRQPHDVTLVVPDAVFNLELKYEKADQMEHQKDTERRMNRVNPKAYYLIRKMRLEGAMSRFKHLYVVYQNDTPLFRCKSLADLIGYFKNMNTREDV